MCEIDAIFFCDTNKQTTKQQNNKQQIAYKLLEHWDKYMCLLDEKYPGDTRTVGLACLLGFLGGDSNSRRYCFYF